MWRLTNVFKEALRPRLAKLYGQQQVDRLLERIALVAGRYNYLEERCSFDSPCWDEHSCILITYGDMLHKPGEPGLVTLERFAGDFLEGIVTVIHILPFFPASSDDGFSVVDYRQVDPALGTWDDVECLGLKFRLMFDLVLNHVSSKSKWFDDFRGAIAPAREYFIDVPPGVDLSQVVRPRALPLLTSVTTVKGEKQVWTTFSDDQIDLDFTNPDVMLEMMDILLGYINRGAAIIRLDAIAYLWKEIGTPCINHPYTHEVVKIFRDVVENVTPGTLLLTETNLPHEENFSYFGTGDEAHIVYQFSLAPLLVHAIQSGTARYLSRWAKSLSPPPPGCTFLNFTASHDGIGVRPLEGLLTQKEIDDLAESVRQCGGFVSSRTGENGKEQPYELNITYFDAMQDAAGSDDLEWQVLRFFCSQIIMLGMRGIPAIYFHSLTGGRNDRQGVDETGMKRRVNRGRWKDEELRKLLADSESLSAIIFNKYTELLRTRAKIAAFHPDALQVVLEADDGLFVFRRLPVAGYPLFCIHNVTGQQQPLNMQTLLEESQARYFKDHLSGKEYPAEVLLEPYQCLWLEKLP